MLEIGQILQEKYRVDRLIGKGGMGQVFEGFHLLIDRRVAIKVLLPMVASSEDGAARFEREVRAAARISNDHILDVFDAGSLPDGSRFMVSEFLDGETLEARLKQKPLSAKETVVLTLELLDGLAAAHRAGITHRDLKPDNIFLTRKGNRNDFVKIIDFGVSKLRSDDPQSVSMTTTGVVIGTPQYLSPEQAHADRSIDHRSDIYTVGVIMYRCVAGRVPFEADSCQAMLFKIALEEPRPLDEAVPGLDRNFSALVDKAMAKERRFRFQSAEEMSHALKRWLDRSGGANAGAAAPPGFGASDTFPAQPVGPTSSNLELNAPTPPFQGHAGKRLRAISITLGLGLLAAFALAATFLAQRFSSAPPSASVTPSPSPSASPHDPTAASSQAQPAPPGDHSATAKIGAPAPLVEPADGTTNAPPQPNGRAAPVAPPGRVPAEPHSHATKPQRTPAPPTATPVEPPAPKATATARARRDFGY
jgi:serine/threonine-protein kinase